ncbi:MAG: tRNA pseudouridine(55) synthase TruB [Clostridiales bacterium]|nr:tRNA pseudouridine(55) synthase TruB [Clostridiales bacterium]
MDGFICVLKPPGMTSNNAVYDVRRVFGVKKVGHLGTLDPGAAGVLPVSIGRATRLFDYLIEKEKTYVCEILFGIRTDTLDVFGKVTERDTDRTVTEQELLSVLPAFTGEIWQTAPAYSALNVDGVKMYKLARAGGEVPERRRLISVPKIELVRQMGENRFLLRVTCSKGTYIRKLCEDIGDRLGASACMAFLLRTGTGMFQSGRGYTIRELEEMKQEGTLQSALISCEEALSGYDILQLKSDRRIPAMNGLETDVRGKDGIYRFYSDGFLGLGEVRNGKARLLVHLY